MKFNFLRKLPNSNLDDRQYKDLVDECLLRINRYCPEWTNYNPSDPGVTLIELFAWLTDQMQLRFNQVPRRNYVAFLELLGIELKPAEPARTNLTFFLSAAQPKPVRIPQDTEVATERTATQEAIVFSTNRDLIVGNPKIKYFLTAESAEDQPSQLRNSFDEPPDDPRAWANIPQTDLFRNAQEGNCFYLVLDTIDTEELQSLNGNILEITFRGESATGTGINPDEPPRVWEAWDGREWQDILRRELDDKTKGFNFPDSEQLSQVLEAGVILHLPQKLPETDAETNFDTDYYGYWIRCVYKRTRQQRPYITSPRITGLSIQSIGGSIDATQCIRVREELIGISNGKPAQSFPLQMQPVLARQPEEYIVIRSLGQEEEAWTEVKDFGSSGADSLHYIIDSQTGAVQFGPLVREPIRLKQETLDRARVTPLPSSFSRRTDASSNSARSLDSPGHDAAGIQERQYSKVPPSGAEIYMHSYRFGGGRQGNVQAERLTVLKAAIPYVSSVTNYEAADGGEEQESLEEAVIRVPQVLRTRECAVTPEDFERAVLQSNIDPDKRSTQRVARVQCLTEREHTQEGSVRLLVVPEANGNWAIEGIHPDEFGLKREFKDDIERYMRDRRPLGINIKLLSPDYVGISVKISGMLLEEQKYHQPRDREKRQEQIVSQLKLKLYQFLNPLEGGLEGKGWSWGRPVYLSDIVSLCQQVPGVRHVGEVSLFEVRKQDDRWVREMAIDSTVDPGPLGLICSWESEETRHEIEIGNRELP